MSEGMHMSASAQGLASADRDPRAAQELRLENVGKAYGGTRLPQAAGQFGALRPTRTEPFSTCIDSALQAD